MYFLVLSIQRTQELWHPSSNEYLMLRHWFLNTILHKKQQGSLDKWLNLGLGQRKYKMILEYLIMEKSKEVIKECRRHFKRSWAMLQDVRSIHKSQLGIYTLAMSNPKNEIKKTIPFTIALKRYKGINLAKEV